jgi:vitamin B12 transporter
MKKAQLFTLSACIVLSSYTYADEDNDVYQQERKVVTASRYEQSELDVIPSISIINREDILNLQANNILDLLSLQQGIDVARTGGNGSQTSVFMRGTNSNHTLVLIDGMRVSSSFTGSFTWENLSISQIESIEIVRGSRVSYYGSDAIGGVINIITRKQDKLYMRYTAGSFGTNNVDAGFGQSTDNAQYSLVIGSQHTDGFSATNENNFFSFNPDDDAYENNSVGLNASYDFESSQLAFNYLESRANVDFDSFYNLGRSKASDRIARLTWQAQIFDSWNSEIALGNNKNSLVTKAFSNDFNSNRSTFDWLMDKNFDTNHVGFGLSYRTEDSEFNHSLINQLNYDNSRNNIAAFANWTGTFNKNILSLSGRFDHNNIYGNNSTGNVDWAYQQSDKLRFNISAGTAFKAPNLNELYSPQLQLIAFSPELDAFVNFFAFEGNLDLEPEESINYEVGLKSQFTDQQDLSFNVFYYKIDNLIDFLGPTFKPTNLNQSSIKGLEAAYNLKYEDFKLNINATVQDANNDETDTPLLRRPDNKVNISLDKFFNKFSVGSSIRYASKSPDFGVDLDSYTVIDLRAAYKFNDHWKLSAKIENAADEEYQIVNGYNTPEASGYITIEWQQ